MVEIAARLKYSERGGAGRGGANSDKWMEDEKLVSWLYHQKISCEARFSPVDN